MTSNDRSQSVWAPYSIFHVGDKFENSLMTYFVTITQSIFKKNWEFILFQIDLKWPLGKKLYLETIFGENDAVWKIILKRHQFSVYFELNKIWF